MTYSISDKILELVGQGNQSLQMIHCLTRETSEAQRIDIHLKKLTNIGEDIRKLARALAVLAQEGE